MKISLIIPLYNKEETILETLKSVFNQIEIPDEIIIVDDGSQDSSHELVEQLNNPLIKLVTQLNQGVSAARNRGVELASYEWVTFLDADDQWDLEFLKEIRYLHKLFPDEKVLATSYKFFYTSGRTEYAVINHIQFPETQGVVDNYFQVAATSHPPINSSAIAIQKNALIEVGGFPVGIKSGEDLITWTRLMLRHRLAYSTRPLGKYIFHAANEGASTIRETDNDPVGKEMLDLLPFALQAGKVGYSLYLGRWLKSKGILLLEVGKNSHARRKFIQSFAYSGERFKLVILFCITLLPAQISKKLISKIYQPF
ncbi:glycosyltransferase involved in cell wall biosynthesis [Algoriphagus sp. 4150]|uniref:glycosyltransferase family 2 protein n=1 Tax=Algoriphagus sp. 4150 TaxID=2817756 RepID=UPI00285B96B3|nr:glycosyltransferase family 2 protein [Algoriphagus sp. 4150]MDR7130546.1 glycosyltransferase involved in cell wall biosynthesis [Algoriphagus sp. 4150]